MRTLDIGILLSPQVRFSFHGGYVCSGVTYSAADLSAVVVGDAIRFAGSEYKRIHFRPCDENAFFTLHDVVIGVNFHWERTQQQNFHGELILFVEQGKIRAVNRLDVETYLKSVISSEMSAGSSLEFLKAHTVISRSWLYAQLLRADKNNCSVLGSETPDEIIRWYAREDHTTFDLCADDHCQRYQGIPQKGNDRVEQAVAETAGIVLTHDGVVCDARFSKCCGGMTERFSACWETVDMPYLQAFRDVADKNGSVDLTNEENARAWIETSPEAFCNTADKTILEQVLNGYDLETNDFYRWQVKYGRQELSELVRERSGIDFGLIEALQPVERAASGRIVRLRIVGNKRTVIVGKELEIRRWLSPSHLYSSAFVVDVCDDASTGEQYFVLKGAGWGHGVGLCQIGAAVMGARGCSYTEILSHYYPNTELCNIESIV
ncbi:MAG: SpoIID/LytB domain-containing protein [Bacteroidaceae bacterium]|nr:SpoIID/LytB domain-containing protein [Bacteroidaceae bacterium]